MSSFSTQSMRVVHSISELDAALDRVRKEDRSIGLVPTMGALHEGHLSLVHKAREMCDCVVVTIFVNPTQFAQSEDLQQYPRTLEEDLQKLEALKVAVVFAPADSEIYTEGFSTHVDPPKIAGKLEGEFRPTHFRGVATVVLKLFNLVGADMAFFGQKDFQQACVIRQMVRDLNVRTKVCICPIVRDEDGLALSSRNVFLSRAQRESALSLNRSLRTAAKMIQDGERDARSVSAFITQSMIEGGVDRVEYAVVADPENLESMEEITLPVVMLVAATVGRTRLIDNWLIEESR